MVKHGLLVLTTDATEVAQEAAAAGHHFRKGNFLRKSANIIDPLEWIYTYKCKQVTFIARLHNTRTDFHQYIVIYFNQLLDVFVYINLAVSGNNFGMECTAMIHTSPQVPWWGSLKF